MTDYRGATVEDLQLSPFVCPFRCARTAEMRCGPFLTSYCSALVLPSTSTVSTAQRLAFEREFDIIPITESNSRRLFGWAQISSLNKAVENGSLSPDASLADAAAPPSSSSTTTTTATGTGSIRKFPKRAAYKTITPDTPLAELERFFQESKTFALVTDSERKFVLGVCTPEDLQKFVKRRNPNNAP